MSPGRNIAERYACPWGNQPQGRRTQGKCHRASGKGSPASCQKCGAQTHFLINIFISFVHDGRSRGDKWEGEGAEASEGEPEADVLHGKQGFTLCARETKDGADKKYPRALSRLSFILWHLHRKILPNKCLNSADCQQRRPKRAYGEGSQRV